MDLIIREFGPNVVSVTAFGSQVKGLARADSDFDFLIIADGLDNNPNVRLEQIASAVTDILFKTGVRISPLVLSREEAKQEAEISSPLLTSILSDYKTLHDPSKFTLELFDLVKRSRYGTTYIERGRVWNLARTV